MNWERKCRISRLCKLVNQFHKTYWYTKRGGYVVGMVFQNIGTIVVSIYNINLFVFRSVQLLCYSHTFSEGEKWFEKNLHSTLYVYTVAAVVQWIRGFVPQAENLVFESQSQRISVVKTCSDSSIVKRSAIGVSVTGPRRWPWLASVTVGVVPNTC